MPRPFDAIPSAWTRTRRILFEPFDGPKYLTLGFCMWLYHLGSVTGTSSGSAPRATDSGGAGEEWGWQEFLDVSSAWGSMFAVFAAVAMIIGIVVWAFVLFFQSRGAFLVIDNIVLDRPAIREPWNAWATEADALFRFRLAVGLGTAAVMVLLAAAAGAGLWATWSGSGLSPAQIVILGVIGPIAAVVGLAAAIVDGCANEFVVPLMYARRISVREGFRELWGYVKNDTGGFGLYLLLRLVATLIVGVITGLLSCLTCGLVLLPFVGTLILLPALVFLRSFSLAFIGQLSEDLAIALRT